MAVSRVGDTPAQPVRPLVWLTVGRTIGFAAVLVIPVVLARSFDTAAFGTYRQLFLIFATAYGIAQFGMAESLYYFLPRRPDVAGRWIANATAVLAVMGAAGIALSVLVAPQVARAFDNPRLVSTLPLLATFVALMLATTALEIVMVSRRQHALAATTYAVSDALRAALMVVPALVIGSLEAVLAGAIAFGAMRAMALAGYLRQHGEGVRLDPRLLRTQWTYALPFAAAVAIEVVQNTYHQYAVAAWFDPVTFAIYSVGCLQVPLVDIMSTSTANVMMVTMGEQVSRGLSPVRLWHEAVGRLAFLLIPIVGIAMLTAHEVITVVFTEKYAAAAPIFTAFSLTFALAALPVDAVLRVYAQTRFLLLLNVLRLAFVASAIGWFVSEWQLMGAVLVTLTAMAAAKATALVRIALLMGIGVREVLPWKRIALPVAASIVAALPALFVKSHVHAGPLPLVLLVGAVYGVTYLALTSGGWRAERLAATRS